MVAAGEPAVAFAFRLNVNIRSSLALGFVDVDGIGSQLLTALSLFQRRIVSLLLIETFGIVVIAEHLSAALRGRI